MHDIVHKHNIRCTKKRVPRFITLEALYTLGRPKISVVSCKNVIFDVYRNLFDDPKTNLNSKLFSEEKTYILEIFYIRNN